LSKKKRKETAIWSSPTLSPWKALRSSTSKVTLNLSRVTTTGMEAVTRKIFAP
jgi:hypothetical protein